MGFLDRFKSPDIHEGVTKFRNTPGSLLLDVRSEEEYAAGHIPGSINLPTTRLGLIDDIATAETKLFTYCQSGARSRKAATILGYKGFDVTDIGGIAHWTGSLLRDGEAPKPPQPLKVVIVGQDPYHGDGQANGLCFSVNPGVAFPPSLRNIFAEIESDLGKPIPTSGDLERWAEQGVLMLNSVSSS